MGLRLGLGLGLGPRACCRWVTCAARHGAKRVVRKRVAARCAVHLDAHRRMARALASRCTARARRARAPLTLPSRRHASQRATAVESVLKTGRRCPCCR